MPIPLPQWASMPRTAKVGIVLWLASWTLFLLFIGILIHDSNWILKLAVAAGILTYCLLAAYNWARMIAMMANLLAIVFLAILAVAFSSQHINYLLIAVGNLIAYGLCTYYLFIGSTAVFYKIQSQPKASQGGDDNRDNQ